MLIMMPSSLPSSCKSNSGPNLHRLLMMMVPLLRNNDNTIYMRVMLRMNLMFSMMGESDGNENNCDFHHNGNVDGY